MITLILFRKENLESQKMCKVPIEGLCLRPDVFYICANFHLMKW